MPRMAKANSLPSFPFVDDRVHPLGGRDFRRMSVKELRGLLPDNLYILNGTESEGALAVLMSFDTFVHLQQLLQNR